MPSIPSVARTVRVVIGSVDDLMALERRVLERVRVVAGLLEVALDERVLVDDHRAAGGRSARGLT